MIGYKTTSNNQYSDIFKSGLVLSGLKTLSNLNNNNDKILKYIEKKGIFEDDFYRVYRNIKKTNLDTNLLNKKDFLTDLILIKGGIIYGFLAHKSGFCDDFLKSALGGIATYCTKNFICNNANLSDFVFGFCATVFGSRIAANKEIESLYNELSEVDLEDSVVGCGI